MSKDRRWGRVRLGDAATSVSQCSWGTRAVWVLNHGNSGQKGLAERSQKEYEEWTVASGQTYASRNCLSFESWETFLCLQSFEDYLKFFGLKKVAELEIELASFSN